MNFATKTTVFALTATVASALIGPIAASASSQDHKNNWRNGAILGGAAALYGLHTHNTTTTILGVAGAAYAANRYEQDRKHQSQRASYRRHHYYRVHHTARYYRKHK